MAKAIIQIFAGRTTDDINKCHKHLIDAKNKYGIWKQTKFKYRFEIILTMPGSLIGTY